ncbi:MAG: DUF6531 domain-containing protein, partial [Candidatus Thiodiazotropha sp.]
MRYISCSYNFILALLLICGSSGLFADEQVVEDPVGQFEHIVDAENKEQALELCLQIGSRYTENPYCRHASYTYSYSGGYWRDSSKKSHHVTVYYPRFFAEFNKQCTISFEGNPCDPATGTKQQMETDYKNSNNSLEVKRYYKSTGAGDGFNDLGPHWRHNHSRKLNGYKAPDTKYHDQLVSNLYFMPDQACHEGWNDIQQKEGVFSILNDSYSVFEDGLCKVKINDSVVAVLLIKNTLNSRAYFGVNAELMSVNLENGSVNIFKGDDGEWSSVYPSSESLSKLGDIWTLRTRGGQIEKFDEDGRLISRSNMGQITRYSYNVGGRLEVVAGRFGDRLVYHYDELGHL